MVHTYRVVCVVQGLDGLSPEGTAAFDVCAVRLTLYYCLLVAHLCLMSDTLSVSVSVCAVRLTLLSVDDSVVFDV